MYVVISIIDRKLGVTKLCQTIEEAVKEALESVIWWPIPELPNSCEIIKKSLEEYYEYLYTDNNDGSEYATYIGKVKE